MLGYISWHLLSSFYHDVSYISFITLFFILVILLSFISVIILLLLTLLFMHEHSSLHTHSLGHFWRPWIRSSRILDILYFSGIRWARTFREELKFLSFGYSTLFLSCLTVIFRFLIYIRFSSYSSSFYVISWVNAYMWYCSDRWYIMV